VVRRVTLDSGVVSALAEGDARVRAHLEAFRRRDVEVIVPSVVIAECTTGRGPRDASVNLVLRGFRCASATEPVARRAAALRHQAGRPHATIDAIIVATAELVGGRALLTRDPADCGALAGGTGVRVEVP